MKVTVKANKKKSKRVPFNKIPVGYVYVVGHKHGCTLLKLNNNEAVLLMYSHDDDHANDWFEIADGYKGDPAYKILGKLTEIIVEED